MDNILVSNVEIVDEHTSDGYWFRQTAAQVANLVMVPDGSGYYGCRANKVFHARALVLREIAEGGPDGERLHGTLTVECYNPGGGGMPYTDFGVVNDLRRALTAAGIAGADSEPNVGWSEAGLNGPTSINVDLGPEVILGLRNMPGL